MGKIRVGNKNNSALNGEWAHHVRGWWKSYTSSRRRNEEKEDIRTRMAEADLSAYTCDDNGGDPYTKNGYTLEADKVTEQIGIKCWDCDMTSFSVDDIAHRYCGTCNRFHVKR